LQDVFGGAHEVFAKSCLDLSTSLRSHLAEDVQQWVKYLLEGELPTAARYAGDAMRNGFKVYATREHDDAVQYVRERYKDEEEKRYGWVASSKATNLLARGIDNSYTRPFREGPWFNDPPESSYSCCQLRGVATEFQCQGLELDMPLVAWGDDLTWSGSGWLSRRSRRPTARDPHKLRLNSYRVLLSRGRDGVVVYVPPDAVLDGTHEALVAAGAERL
jgi:hypothetical protein